MEEGDSSIVSSAELLQYAIIMYRQFVIVPSSCMAGSTTDSWSDSKQVSQDFHPKQFSRVVWECYIWAAAAVDVETHVCPYSYILILREKSCFVCTH